MSDQPFNSYRGGRGGGRGRGRGGNRGGFNRGGRGGFHNSNGFQNNNSKQYTEVDYSPEAIEARFSVFYSPSITKNPWSHLTQVRTD